MDRFVLISESAEELSGGLPMSMPLPQVFAQVCCRAGLNYHFEQAQECWRLVLIDVERPDCSPEPITSTYIKRADAQRDLMLQAVDGRLRGCAALPFEQAQRQFQVMQQAAE